MPYVRKVGILKSLRAKDAGSHGYLAVNCLANSRANFRWTRTPSSEPMGAHQVAQSRTATEAAAMVSQSLFAHIYMAISISMC